MNRLPKTFLYCCGITYDTCCILLLILGAPALLFSKKLRQYFRSRGQLIDIISLINTSGDKPVFIYCSSIGELEQALPLIGKMKSASIPCIIFVHSENGMRHAQNLNLEHVALTPLDFFFNWLWIFRTCPPRVCIINRHECWPGFVLNALNVSPLYLINTVEKSYGNAIYRTYIQWLRRQCAAVFFVNNPLKKGANFFISGDTRIDRLRERRIIESQSIATLKALLEGHHKKVLVLGNAYNEDAAILSQVLRLKPEILERWYCVIVPARPEMAHEVQTALGVCSGDVEVDASFGKLFTWYQCADAAWIGGGFNNKGIHNTLEALIAGAVLLSGPNLAQQPDAIMAVQNGLLYTCSNAEECIRVLELRVQLSKPEASSQTSSPTDLIFNSIFHPNSVSIN